MKFNSDFKYDLEVGQVEERWLAQLFTSAKIEVKRDFIAHKTGNLFVEFESRGRPSGIATSQADYWAFILQYKIVFLIPTQILKEKCRVYFKCGRVVKGGDSDTSRGVLLPLSEITNYS